MNVQSLAVTQDQAVAALREYKTHRGVYDRHDWEIERIYRQIARGKTVISANDAIRRAGVDDQGRPRLAIMAADQQVCRCYASFVPSVTFTNEHRSRAREWHWEIPWERTTLFRGQTWDLVARLPRIPPQHRPRMNLRHYQVLWEADWTAIPRDPYLLKRIGLDAYVVLAAWDLTDVELSVLRAYQ